MVKTNEMASSGSIQGTKTTPILVYDSVMIFQLEMISILNLGLVNK